jgi:hypothetical protein
MKHKKRIIFNGNCGYIKYLVDGQDFIPGYSDQPFFIGITNHFHFYRNCEEHIWKFYLLGQSHKVLCSPLPSSRIHKTNRKIDIS